MCSRHTRGMGKISKGLASFSAGIIMTLILVVFVPVFVERHVTPAIVDIVGDGTFLQLSSSFIVSSLVWVVMMGFVLILGAGGIMKRFGILGILGLVVAYYLLGDVTQAAVPILSLIAVSIVFWIYRKKKEGRRDQPPKNNGKADIPD